MKAYYITWLYPPTADDFMYYEVDENKLFHHRKNAEKYVSRKLELIKELESQVSIIRLKSKFEELTDGELEIDNIGCVNFPTSYNIKEIKFEDEL